MAKKPLLTGLVFCLAVLLAGCSPLTFQYTSDLLRAPALGRQQGEIQKALAETLREEPQYKYPKEGELRSPLVMADLNNDGREEGVLLYTLPGNAAATPEVSSTVNVAVLEQIEGEWVVTQDVKGRGTEVASLQVADLLGDGTKQLLVGFGNTKLSKKELAIYTYADAKLKLVQGSLTYSRYELGDFTGRGGTDLLLVSLLDQPDRLQLYYIPTKDGAFLETRTPVALDSNFESCSGLYPSLGPDGKRVVVVDGVVRSGNQTMLASQLVYYPNEEENFFTYAETLRGQTARRSMLLKSRDIDGDGIVEIPKRVGQNEVVTLSGKKLEYVEWLDFTATAIDAGAAPDVKQFGLLDPDRAIYIRFPDGWRDTLKVTDGNGKDEWRVLRQNTQQALLELRVLEAGQTPPIGALQVPGYLDTCLMLANSLSAAERAEIQIVALS